MVESPPRLSTPALAHARETYDHCIRYLLIQWYNPPKDVPAQEAGEVLSDIRRVICLLVDDLETSVPGTRDQLLREMRGLSDLISTPAPGASADPVATRSESVDAVGITAR